MDCRACGGCGKLRATNPRDGDVEVVDCPDCDVSKFSSLLDIECYLCGAKYGEPCTKKPSGEESEYVHTSRITARGWLASGDYFRRRDRVKDKYWSEHHGVERYGYIDSIFKMESRVDNRWYANIWWDSSPGNNDTFLNGRPHDHLILIEKADPFMNIEHNHFGEVFMPDTCEACKAIATGVPFEKEDCQPASLWTTAYSKWKFEERDLVNPTVTAEEIQAAIRGDNLEPDANGYYRCEKHYYEERTPCPDCAKNNVEPNYSVAVQLSSGEVCSTLRRAVDNANDETRPGLLIALGEMMALTNKRRK